MAETRLRDDGRLSLKVADIHSVQMRQQLANARGPGEVMQFQRKRPCAAGLPDAGSARHPHLFAGGGVCAPGPAEQAMLPGFARFLQNDSSLLGDAQRDALTGLRNRKTFDDVILRLFAGGAAAGLQSGGDLTRRQARVDPGGAAASHRPSLCRRPVSRKR